MAASAETPHPRERAAHGVGRSGAGRVLATALLAAGAAGLLVSVAARALMRLVAVAAGHQGAFSWQASLGIAVVFTAAMLPGALWAVVTDARGRWVPLAVGALLLLVPATGIASDEIGSTSALSRLERLELLSVSAGVYVCIGVLPVVTLRLVDRWHRA